MPRVPLKPPPSDKLMGPPATFGQPILQVASKETRVIPVEKSPLTLSPTVKLVLIILSVIAAAVVALPASGVAIPSWAVAIAALVGMICTALGIKGPETTKKPEEPK